jgi:hypothetical protein
MRTTNGDCCYSYQNAAIDETGREAKMMLQKGRCGRKLELHLQVNLLGVVCPFGLLVA